ncbi:MAG TPA: 2-dehydropantoate 2-reductase N-terminal domain-containing protein [Kofleriaceae bacterium]|nr:2-dehydropantoate 2-reductase N-terminal domain-containing protein [Kofleriaceae bacterium]
MRALIVGAGSIGQVLAHALRAGGAEVAFLVKPAHAAEARAGFTLYPLGRRRERWRPVRLDGVPVLTETPLPRFDTVLLAVSSPALATGTWLAELAAATGDATMVALQPGAGDAARVAAVAGAERVVSGAIGLMAWSAPLRGQQLPAPGTAYWVPPLSTFPLTGAPARVRPLVAALRAGGIPAAAHADAPAVAALGSALLETQVAALRCAGWSRTVLRGDPRLVALAGAAAREALSVIAADRGRRPPLPARLAARVPAPLLLGGLAGLAPMTLEHFLARHYGKVTAQTRATLDGWIARGEALGVATGALETLRDRWQAQVNRA